MALLAGQAVLCAVIGWVTFGPSEPGPQGKSAVAPLAGLPIVASAPNLGLPATTTTPTTPNRKKKKASPRSSSYVPVLPPAAPVEDVDDRPLTEDPSPSTLIAPAPTTTLAPPGPELAGSGSPTPTPTPSTQHPVVVNEPCTPEGGFGLTDDDQTLRCDLVGGELVWRAI
jgi:hypothetical protein